MEDPIDEDDSCRDAGGDHIADSADHRSPFNVRRVDDACGVVLTLGGELDLATVPLLQEQLDRAMRGRRVVVIDLSGMRFIDSSGLRTLLRAERKLRGSGGQLVLVPGSRAVRRAFELTRLDRYFAWCESPSAAVRTARERSPRPRRIPTPAADRRTEAELDRQLGGAMWS